MRYMWSFSIKRSSEREVPPFNPLPLLNPLPLALLIDNEESLQNLVFSAEARRVHGLGGSARFACSMDDHACSQYDRREIGAHQVLNRIHGQDSLSPNQSASEIGDGRR